MSLQANIATQGMHAALAAASMFLFVEVHLAIRTINTPIISVRPMMGTVPAQLWLVFSKLFAFIMSELFVVVALVSYR